MAMGVKTIFESDTTQADNYAAQIEASLKLLFPTTPLDDLSDSQLPIFRWFWRDDHLALHFVCRHRLNIGKFFFEMIHRWLLPGRRLDVASFFCSDFRLIAEGRLFTIAEMAVRLGRDIDRHHVEHNLRVIETEIRLGMISVYHASRLLETHLISSQAKNGVLQEKISNLIQKCPDDIDYDIFGELQHFTVMSHDEFKTPRNPHHLSRLIALFYLFRKSIERQPNLDRRHIRLKIAPVYLDVPWGRKRVVAICLGVNLIRHHELFEERHLVRAIQNGMEGVQPVIDSFFVNESGRIHTLYIEIEKSTGEEFSPSELARLKRFLPEEVKRSIEVPLKSVFMPRNEEEIIRHIVTLSGQLKYLKDLPQAVLIFDQQKGGDLYFTVIVVRIVLPTTVSIQSLFQRDDTTLSYLPDRVKRVGMVRKKYPKEATVFRVKLATHPFLRDDQSVDLFRARQTVLQELQKVMGEVRDYNGGMIAKQIEHLTSLQLLLQGRLKSNHHLLETFFHSLYPIEARSVIPPQQLQRLFIVFKKLVDQRETKVEVDRDEKAVVIVGREGYLAEVDPSNYQEMQLVVVRPETDESFLGYLFFSQDVAEQAEFLGTIRLDSKLQTD